MSQIYKNRLVKYILLTIMQILRFIFYSMCVLVLGIMLLLLEGVFKPL